MGLLDKLTVWSLPFIPKPIVGYFSKPYIAGSKLEDAVKIIKELNGRGIMATIDLLGEEITHKDQAAAAAEEYKDILREIDREKLDANVSVKPTHMGLLLDEEFCFNNIRAIVQEAVKFNNFVRIDMEDHTATDQTIDMYLRLKKEFDGHVGTVIQSYMRRTMDDINHLIEHKANLRLCKGIYNEPREVAYKDMFSINDNYNYNLRKLLSNGCYTGIATHDEKLVWYALSVIDELKLDKKDYEFQMLLGVDEQLRDIIVAAGHRMRIYVPYGKDWYAYSVRRLKENPRMAGYILKKILHLK